MGQAVAQHTLPVDTVIEAEETERQQNEGLMRLRFLPPAEEVAVGVTRMPAAEAWGNLPLVDTIDDHRSCRLVVADMLKNDADLIESMLHALACEQFLTEWSVRVR